MAEFGRRALLGGTAGLAASTVLARPYIARAQDKTLTVWWNQGFYPAEDQAFHDMVTDWEKQSGYKMNLSMIEGNALDQKVISATTTGQVPDLIYSDHGSAQTMPQAAWDGKLVDLSDVVATQKDQFSDTALKSAAVLRQYDQEAVVLWRAAQGAGAEHADLAYAGGRGRLPDVGYPEDLGQVLRFLRAGPGQAAQEGDAARLWVGIDAVHQRRRSLQPVQSNVHCLWRGRAGDAGWQAARGRSDGAQGTGRFSGDADHAVQEGLRAAGCDQLGRSR